MEGYKRTGRFTLTLGVLVFGVVYVDGGYNRLFHPIQSTPNHQTHNSVQVIEPPKRVLVEREVCNRISGCEVVNGTCPTCVVEKVWE